MPGKSYIIDMDGVLYRGEKLIPGAREFVEKLERGGHKYLFVTNNSTRSRAELRRRLLDIGLDVGVEHFFTSALATASFLDSQKPRGSAYVIGDAGLVEALREVGYTITELAPDYVVVGETHSYDFAKISKAVNLILGGARFVATNPDVTGPKEEGIVPACGALVAPIQMATDREPFFVGKPNSFMMRAALRKLDDHSENTIIIGDRMETDILAGIGAGMETVLVLTGVTARGDLPNYSYQPHYVCESLAEVEIA